MRVLFVAPYAPTRIRVRTFGFVRELARRHTVTVVALAHGTDRAATADLDELRSAGATIHLVGEPRYAPPLRGVRAALPPVMGGPLQVAFAAAPAMRAAVEREVRRGGYDVLHVEHVRGLGVLPATLPLPVVWDAVDCVSLLFEESARAATNPLLRLVSPLEARRLRSYEWRQVRRFGQVLVTSERDKQALLALRKPTGHAAWEGWRGASSAEGKDGGEGAEGVGERIVVLPHGLDRSRFTPYRGPRQREEVIFSGRMSYHANVAGVCLLAERILPLIWREHPAVHLTIAGADPPASVRRLARDPRITVTGYVPDLRPLISTARVSISPLPYAVGIQNKMIEAMALGTPVIASASAAHGLEAVAGQDFLVGETPEDLARAVCRVLDDSALAQALAEHGVRYVETHHDWDAIADQLTTVYARAVAAAALATARARRAAGTVPTAAAETADVGTARIPERARRHGLRGLGGARQVTT